MNWNWLLGFIEGEGSFVISTGIASTMKGKYRYVISPFFSIAQVHDDDNKNVELMKSIQTFLAENDVKSGVYTFKYPRNGNLWYRDRLMVYGFANNLKLGNILKDLQWYTKKKNTFNIWFEAVEMVNKKEHLTENGMKRIVELKMQLNEISKYSKKPKNFDFRINREKYAKILKLHSEGQDIHEISKNLNICLETVKKYLYCGEMILNKEIGGIIR